MGKKEKELKNEVMETNKIYNENCLDTMAKMPDNFIDLTVTSPPYDNLRDYKGYSFPFEEIAKELYRVTKQGGVLVWVVGDATMNGSESGTSFKQALFFKEIGFNLHDTMIWQKTNPMPKVKTKRYFDVFEYMFIFSKGVPKTFNPIMVDCKMGGKIYDSTCKNMGGENGRTKKTFVLNKQRYKNNIWEIAIAQNKTKHPAVFPEQLAQDHILSWSNENDIIYDPFMGSGTTAKMSILNNRNWIGSEISSEYCNIIEERIKKAYCPECGKEIFRTRAEANLALRNMRNRHKTCGSVYQCETCRGFHLTHLTYRKGRRRYRGKGFGKVGTKDGTMHGTIKSLSHKNDEKAGQWDNENPILSHALSHAEQSDNQSNNPKMGQWDNENGKKQKYPY